MPSKRRSGNPIATVTNAITAPWKSANRKKRAEAQSAEYRALTQLGEDRLELERMKRKLADSDQIFKADELKRLNDRLEEGNKLRAQQREAELAKLRDAAEYNDLQLRLLQQQEAIERQSNPPPPELEPSVMDSLNKQFNQEREIDQWMLQKLRDIDDLVRQGLSSEDAERQRKNVRDQARQAKRKL